MFPAVDTDYVTRVLLELLKIPSPTGFTHDAVAYLQNELAALGVASRLTTKGALLWTLPGAGRGPTRTVAAHVDTLGALVKEVKKNGRLKLSAVGGYDWATVEGAECRIHTHGGAVVTGTVVNTKQSSHVFGAELRDLKRNDKVMEVRPDVETRSRADTLALGVGVGDFVSFDSHAVLTENGFVKGRHLDNKAAVAICLGATRALLYASTAPAGDLHFFISNYEEVGHGAAAGIPSDTAELLCIDMAAVGEGQTSDEYSVTLCVKDSSGPYDFELNARLRSLAAQHGIDLKIDIYPFYGSDASAAWRAGGSFRAALIGPGVDASHAFERTHQKALDATARLLLAYALDDETLEKTTSHPNTLEKEHV
ncbi:M42 family metallopeptidase [soil metagenome]